MPVRRRSRLTRLIAAQYVIGVPAGPFHKVTNT